MHEMLRGYLKCARNLSQIGEFVYIYTLGFMGDFYLGLVVGFDACMKIRFSANRFPLFGNVPNIQLDVYDAFRFA